MAKYVGDAAGAPLRSLAARLPEVGRHAADHRFHRRPDRGEEESGTAGRADRGTPIGPGAGPAAVGGGKRRRPVGATDAGVRIRSAPRVVAETFQHSGGDACTRGPQDVRQPASCGPRAGKDGGFGASPEEDAPKLWVDDGPSAWRYSRYGV